MQGSTWFSYGISALELYDDAAARLTAQYTGFFSLNCHNWMSIIEFDK